MLLLYVAIEQANNKMALIYAQMAFNFTMPVIGLIVIL